MDKQRRNPITGWWETMPEPRAVPLLLTVFYGIVLAAGLSAVLVPPAFLSFGLGGGLATLVWGGLLAFGGAVGVPSVIPGAYWAERIAVAAVGLAVLLYAVAVFELQRYTDSNVVYQGLINLGLLVHVLIRAARIRHGLHDPEKIPTKPRPRGE